MRIHQIFIIAALFVGPTFPLVAAKADAPAVKTGEPVPAALARTEIREFVRELAQKLEQLYVFPDTGHKYAASLRFKTDRGGYDDASTHFDLTNRLTGDLQNISPDRHLRVRPLPPVSTTTPVAPTAISNPAVKPNNRPRSSSQNSRWFNRGIAYFRLTEFTGTPDSVAAAEQFMKDHARAKTIIFDIRRHRGGGLMEMDAIFPYLFQLPTTLLIWDTRASAAAALEDTQKLFKLRRIPGPEDFVRMEHFVVPHSTERRLFGAQILVLTSNSTRSAAEHFALALKRTGRATLIGETTGGAGHFGQVVRFKDKFGAFIPTGRTFDPDTGKGWEGIGVSPHVPIPAEQALIEALIRSGIPKANASDLAAQMAPLGG